MSNSDYHLCSITAMYKFSKLACDEQITACAERFKVLFGLSHDVNSILNTPNAIETIEEE